jgi:muramidase (phage lysozyme)
MSPMTESKSCHSSASESRESESKTHPLPFSPKLSFAAVRKTVRFPLKQGFGHQTRSEGFPRPGWRNPLLFLGLVLVLLTLRPPFTSSWKVDFSGNGTPYPPLAMADGDPYLRALMRTISASESNDAEPYSLLYGGERFSDWLDHPDRCLTITVGPNTGDCTTAAGRYQFITTTWDEKAKIYHPNPSGWWVWQQYPFDPVSQDKVVYRWLDDPGAWNADIPAMLRAKRVSEVLSLLSGTWTSLGYGIETNSMSSQLEDLYRKFLQEELSRN